MTDEFRLTEKLLYEYMANLARLEILKDDLHVLRGGSDVKAQNYSLPNFSTTHSHSDPVSFYVERCEKLEEEISKLERFTIPITKLREDLNSTYVLEGSEKFAMKIILEFFYFGGNPLSLVLEKLHISRRNMYDVRTNLVKLAGVYLGIEFLVR